MAKYSFSTFVDEHENLEVHCFDPGHKVFN
jgi:hypothetical protein